MRGSKKERTVPAATEKDPRRRSRRQALGLAGAAAAAATVAALGFDGRKRAEAGVGDPLYLGVPNDTDNVQTELRGNVDPGAALWVGALGGGEGLQAENLGSGTALAAHARSGLGVNASTKGQDAAVHATALLPGQDPEAPPQGPADGVRGISGTGIGVHGISQSGPAVLGMSESGPGVAAASLTGAAVRAHGNVNGVEARGSSGVGVHGDTFDGIGVRAQCLGAPNPEHPMGPELALDVVGKARFSTAGAGIVRARANAATVENPAVTADSHITVTFTRDPGGASVAWVKRQAGTGFIVHLSGRPWRNVPFTYLIVEPGG